MKVKYANLVDIEIQGQEEIKTAVEFLGGVIDKTIDRVLPNVNTTSKTPVISNNPDLENSLKEKDDEINKLKEEIADKQFKIALFEKEIKDGAVLVEDLNSRINEYSEQIKELNEKVQNIEKEKAEMEENFKSELDGAYNQINELSANNTELALKNQCEVGVPKVFKAEDIQFTNVDIEYAPMTPFGEYDIINCTNHDVVVKDSSGDVTVFPPSGIYTRCIYNASFPESGILASLCRTEMITGVIDMPPQREKKLYIVSRMIYDCFPDRDDLLTPNSIVDNVYRDAKGGVVAIKSLICRKSLIEKVM